MTIRAKRNCQNCGKPDHMTRVVDAQANVFDVRYRVCYRCHPELDAGSHLNGPEGGLRAMKSDLRDGSWDVLETMPRDMGSEDEAEEYASEDTVLNVSDSA